MFDIRTSEQGGCGCLTWFIRDKNTLNVILARNKRKSDNGVTCAFLTRFLTDTGPNTPLPSHLELLAAQLTGLNHEQQLQLAAVSDSYCDMMPPICFECGGRLLHIAPLQCLFYFLFKIFFSGVDTFIWQWIDIQWDREGDVTCSKTPPARSQTGSAADVACALYHSTTCVPQCLILKRTYSNAILILPLLYHSCLSVGCLLFF